MESSAASDVDAGLLLLRPTLAHVLVERVSSTNDAMSAVVTYDVQRDVSDMTTCLLIF